MPCFITCQSEGWFPPAVGTRVCTCAGVYMPVGVGVGCDARETGTRSQAKHTQAHTSPPGFDTLQTYMHTCTLETWLRGIENTHIILDGTPHGS